MSTDTQYTPGPWRIKRNPVTVQILASNGDYIAENVRSLPNQEANARLIAAAPDLLAALKALVAETVRCDCPGLYGVSQDDPVMDAAKAALAKAEGGPR